MLLAAVLGFIISDDYPQFEKADKGFEPRGTEISGAARAYERHLLTAQCEGQISSHPYKRRSWHMWGGTADDDVENHYDFDYDGDLDQEFCNYNAWIWKKNNTRRALGEAGVNDGSYSYFNDHPSYDDDSFAYSSPIRDYFEGYQKKMLPRQNRPIDVSLKIVGDSEYAFHEGELTEDEDGRKLFNSRDQVHCTQTSADVDSRLPIEVVLEARDGEDLMSLRNLQAMCAIDSDLRGTSAGGGRSYNPNYCKVKVFGDFDEYGGENGVCNETSSITRCICAPHLTSPHPKPLLQIGSG